MGTFNYIRNINSGSSSAGLSTVQPTVPALWLDNSKLMYFDGVNNFIIDINEGDVLDAFDQDLGIDI